MEGNTEGNQTLEGMYKSLAEVQTTNRFILRRLNHVVDSETSGTCCCSRTKYDGESEESYKDLETRLANVETKQVETADSLMHCRQQLTEIQNTVKELQKNPYSTRNTPMHSFEITPVKGKHPDDEYKTLETKQSLTSTKTSKDNCEKQNNEGETKNSVKSGLDSNADKANSNVNKADTLELNRKYDKTTTSETATVLQAYSFDHERNETELSATDVNTIIANNELNNVDKSLSFNVSTGLTDEKDSTTVKQVDVSDQQTKPFGTSDTATVLQEIHTDVVEKNATELSTCDVDESFTNAELDETSSGATGVTDEKYVTTVLLNDACEQQIQSTVTSDTVTVLQEISTDVERNSTEISTAGADKSITDAEVDKSLSNSETSGLTGKEHDVIVLQYDNTEQQAKLNVMPETATKLQGNSIDYNDSATELSTTDVNTSITDDELNTVDKSVSIDGLSGPAEATITATVEQKDVSEQETKPTKDESGDGSTRAVNIQINKDDIDNINNSLNPDNITSKLENAAGTPTTDSGKINENEIKIKPEKCTSKDKKESLIKIKKPNFCRRRSSMDAIDMPGVIEQNQKKFYEDHQFWDYLAHQEIQKARSSGMMDIDGAHTVLCIDISLSMSRDDAWKHVTTFLNSYIGGLEEVAREHRFKDEHVAIATFGHQTRVIQTFTNDFSKLRTSLGNIKLGGPSPLYGGLEMATCAAASAANQTGRINGIPVPTKIVLITDGELTDSCLYQGPDEADLNKLEETKTHVLSTMEFYQSKPPIDFFCTPVGNANTDFLQLMTGVANGKMISYMEGRQFARRSYLMTKTRLSMSLDHMGLIGQMSGSGSSRGIVIRGSDLMSGLSSSDTLGFLSQMSEQSSSDPLGLFSQMSGRSSSDPMDLFNQMSGQSYDKEDKSLSTQDKEQIEDIKKDAKSYMDRVRNSMGVTSTLQDKIYLDPNSSKLPAVGTRVRRGPDWKYHMQDSNGPGTVTGQYEGGMKLWVEWDADAHTDNYRYGGHGYYDLLIVDEPRKVTDGKLAVGCIVRPGKDFQYKHTKVGPQERGVAIKINQVKHTVRVKWSNKESGKYKYSDNRHGKMEVEMCSNSSPHKKPQPNMFPPEQEASEKSPYRNKNKNT